MENILLTLAEIAITFAGLIGIMVAFSTGDGKMDLSDSLRVRVILLVSIYSAFFALLPLALLSIAAAAPHAWTASVILFLLFLIVFGVLQRSHEVRAGAGVVEDIRGVHRYAAWALLPIVVLINIVNISTLLGPVQPGFYALALLLFMFAGGIVFIGLVFQRLL